MYYIELENCPTSENNRMYVNVNEVDKMNHDNNVFDVYSIAIHGDGDVREYDFSSESERYNYEIEFGYTYINNSDIITVEGEVIEDNGTWKDYIGCTIWYHVDHCI